MSKLPDEAFRDTIGTIDEEGNRFFLKPSGKFYDYRKWVSYFTDSPCWNFYKDKWNQFMMFNILNADLIF
jgi:hypothetical protein